MSWRLLQWHWIATAFRNPSWRWWRSTAFLGTAVVLAKFLVPELLVLLAFAPASWLVSAMARAGCLRLPRTPMGSRDSLAKRR